jgi:hypothetical protein
MPNVMSAGTNVNSTCRVTERIRGRSVDRQERRRPGRHRRAELLGIDAQLVAGVGLECPVGVAHHGLGHGSGLRGVEAALLVDVGQFPGLELGAAAQLAGLDPQLPQQQL